MYMQYIGLIADIAHFIYNILYKNKYIYLTRLRNDEDTVCYIGLHDTILWDTITRYQAVRKALALSQTLVTSPPFLVIVIKVIIYKFMLI